MAKKKKKEKNFAAKLGIRIFGLAMLLLSAFMLASVFFFNLQDSFFNTASGEFSNYLGSFGDICADFCLSWFGFALPLFLIAPLVWGYHLLRLREVINPYSRVFAFFFGSVCFATVLSLVPQTWGLGEIGGNVGKFFSRYLLTIFNSIYVYAYGTLIFALLLLLLSILAFDFAVGITYTTLLHWIVAFGHAVNTFVILLLGGCCSLFSFALHSPTLLVEQPVV